MSQRVKARIGDTQPFEDSLRIYGQSRGVYSGKNQFACCAGRQTPEHMQGRNGKRRVRKAPFLVSRVDCRENLARSAESAF